jgi:thiosulfate/3-mercaptopyruvate sulfurtransferase
MKQRVLTIVIISFVFMLGSAIAQTQPAADMLFQTDWLATHLNDADLVLLHIGAGRSSYDAAHITGARFVAWSDVTTTRNGVPNQMPAVADLQSVLERVGVSDASRVVIYGDTPLLAAHVYFALDYLGHANHALLNGGLEKWKAEQRATSTAAPEIKAAKLTANPHPELMLDMAAVQKIVAEKKVPLIDGRPPEQYAGTNAGDGIKRGGHIPGAKNVFWMKTLVSKENPVLKPVADIRALYEAAGAKPGETVAVYCRTGPIATQEYFTLKLAGFKPAVYGGSFMEWSNAAAAPSVEPGS